jgi:uncharacterized protein (TIGR02266 family)
MSADKERRRDPRVPLLLRVDCAGASPSFREVTENLSAGGLFLRTERALRAGERLPLRIDFPGLLDPIAIEVEVVRLRAPGPHGPAGAAVRIPADRVEDRRRLEALAVASADERTARRAFRVLVVEDNPHVVVMYEYALRKIRSGEGVDVTVEFAANGHDALARLGGPPRVDLVMADLYMPVMDGFALVERIRADAAIASTPILVISAGAADARARALALGVDVYLQKPVQFSDVIGTVRALLRLER